MTKKSEDWVRGVAEHVAATVFRAVDADNHGLTVVDLHDERFTVVVSGPEPGTSQTAVLTRQQLAELHQSVGEWLTKSGKRIEN
jgi:hypothetical protein